MQAQKYFVFALLAQLSRIVFSRVINNSSHNSSDAKDSMKENIYLVFKNENLTLTLDEYLEIREEDEKTYENLRIKRQSGAGKYPEAAKMGQMKSFKLLLQMIKNLWAPAYVGSAHPLHHETPKAIVFLFKQKVTTIFFPEVGVPDKTDLQADKTPSISNEIALAIHREVTTAQYYDYDVYFIRDKREIYDNNYPRSQIDRYTDIVKLPHKKLLGYMVAGLRNIYKALKAGPIFENLPEEPNKTPKPLMYLKDYFLSFVLPNDEREHMMARYEEPV